MGVWSTAWWSAVDVTALVAAAGFCGVWWRSRRRPHRFCPGPWRRRHILLLPYRWLLGNPCRYDLSGLPEPGGVTTCPECGARSPRRRRVRSTSLLRWPRVAFVMLAVWCGVLAAPVVRHCLWIPYTPTSVLVAAKWVCTTTGLPLHDRLRRELANRIWAGSVTGGLARIAAAAYAHDLRSDSVDWNGQSAAWFLRKLGPAGRQVLLESLDTDDSQARQLSLQALLEESHATAPPLPCTEPVLRTCLEALRDASPRRERVCEIDLAFDYLVQNVTIAEPRLLAWLSSDDLQQRVWCAAVLIRADRREQFAEALPVLIAGLRSNDERYDACTAGEFLWEVKDAARPYLLEACRSDDAQQRRYARGVLSASVRYYVVVEMLCARDPLIEPAAP